MIEADCFIELNITSKVSDAILNKVKNASEDEWVDFLEQSIFSLKIEDFKDDDEIYKAIQNLGAHQRISVFRFLPNYCYNWHSDKIRYGAINMLLQGFDSFCAFGKIAPYNKYSNIQKLTHKPNKYYLINVKQRHCVFNFSDSIRYIVSIGIPNITYEDSVKYFKSRNLI